ncbi:MAG: class I SAM-dependent methyltransferase [Defluviicoccus sp.]|nr:class I SAM-dependent methyltransferase [Defluviicoccus sp.]
MDAVQMPGWLDELRRDEIIGPVRNDPRSHGGTRFGMTMDEAVEAIGRGQADFDAQLGTLSPDDLALLYAFMNQRGHVEELVTAFGQLLAGARPENPIVVDIGCGPFTGGLALAATLGDETRFDYIGIDRAKSMRRLGARLAGSDHIPGRVRARWAIGMGAVDWPHRPGWRDVIVILSYLFASPTLDVEAMFGDLEGLLDRLGRGAVTLLYTNSTRRQPNRRYPEFRQLLEAAGFELHAEDQEEIVVERRDRLQNRSLYYALFHRPQRRVLCLGE